MILTESPVKWKVMNKETKKPNPPKPIKKGN